MLKSTPRFLLRPACTTLVVLACFATAAPAAPEPRDAALQNLLDQALAVEEMAPSGAAADKKSLMNQVRDTASSMVMTAMNFLGVPYRRGGESAEQGFDCSGFTRHIFEMSLGLVLPRRAEEQARAPGFTAVKREELRPGDLVFFNTLRRTFSHVGIYVGDGKFIHSPHSGSAVRVEDMRNAYWTRRFTGARRAPEAATPAASPRGAPAQGAAAPSASSGR